MIDTRVHFLKLRLGTLTVKLGFAVVCSQAELVSSLTAWPTRPMIGDGRCSFLGGIRTFHIVLTVPVKGIHLPASFACSPPEAEVSMLLPGLLLLSHCLTIAPIVTMNTRHSAG